jgi:hypothetical protein
MPHRGTIKSSQTQCKRHKCGRQTAQRLSVKPLRSGVTRHQYTIPCFGETVYQVAESPFCNALHLKAHEQASRRTKTPVLLKRQTAHG